FEQSDGHIDFVVSNKKLELVSSQFGREIKNNVDIHPNTYLSAVRLSSLTRIGKSNVRLKPKSATFNILFLMSTNILCGFKSLCNIRLVCLKIYLTIKDLVVNLSKCFCRLEVISFLKSIGRNSNIKYNRLSSISISLKLNKLESLMCTILISRIAVGGIPSSWTSIRIFFTATISFE
ncbi:hypothetical protein AGLY_014803, partial [Aphis glycines]